MIYHSARWRRRNHATTMRRITSTIALATSTAPTMSHPWLPCLNARAASAPAPTAVVTRCATAQENRNQASLRNGPHARDHRAES